MNLIIWIPFCILASTFYHHFLTPVNKTIRNNNNDSSLFERYTVEHHFYIQDPIIIDNLGILFF